MSSPCENRPKSAFRIITLLLFFSFLGNFIAGIVCYFQPKTYESTGIFAEAVAPNQSTPLAGAHAATIVSDESLHLRWDIPFEDAVAKLKEIVRIETTAAGTVIRAQSTSAQIAHIIAGAVMKTYPGFEREAEWAQSTGLDDRYTSKETKTQREVEQLRVIILETLRETGQSVPGTILTAETVARIGNEDLSRQFGAYRKMAYPSGRFAPVDGNIAVPPPITARPVEPEDPISPDIDSYFLVGKIGGLIAALVTIFTILRRHPSLLEVPPPKRAATPAWAEIPPLADREDPTW